MTHQTLTKRENTFVVILPNENKIKFTARSIHCGGRHFQVLCEFFHCYKFKRLSNYRRGKIQLHTTHWTPISAYIECVLAVIFADPQREGYKVYKFHSLLGSVGKLSAETNFNFPAPPFHHFPGICKKSSRHVTSRNQGPFSREEERGPWERGCCLQVQ